MTVFLIGNYLPDGQPSMQRFAANMATGLAAEGIEATLIRPEAFWGRIARHLPRVQKWAGYVDKLITFPRQLRRLVALSQKQQTRVVFHICDHSNAPYVHCLAEVPHVVTCHDLFAVRSARGEIPLQPTRWSGRRLQEMIMRGLNKARMIACDSEATRTDVLRLIQPDPCRVSTALLSLDDDQWSPAPASRNEDWRDVVRAYRTVQASPLGFTRFILHVGGEAWYKNRKGVVNIFSLLPPETAQGVGLIMVGPPLKPDILDLIGSQLGMKDRILCLQNVSDTDLAVLYRSAEALLFPSLDEGFGWPVLEAHACGCRVVASGRGSLPEVGGSAMFTIDPSDEVGAAAVLEKVLAQTDDERRAAKQAALANAARFSLSATTRRYISIYESLLQE